MAKIMTLEETARYLRIHKATLYRLAQQNKVPAFKIGNQWRFNKEVLDKLHIIQRKAKRR